MYVVVTVNAVDKTGIVASFGTTILPIHNVNRGSVHRYRRDSHVLPYPQLANYREPARKTHTDRDVVRHR